MKKPINMTYNIIHLNMTMKYRDKKQIGRNMSSEYYCKKIFDISTNAFYKLR